MNLRAILAIGVLLLGCLPDPAAGQRSRPPRPPKPPIEIPRPEPPTAESRQQERVRKLRDQAPRSVVSLTTQLDGIGPREWVSRLSEEEFQAHFLGIGPNLRFEASQRKAQDPIAAAIQAVRAAKPAERREPYIQLLEQLRNEYRDDILDGMEPFELASFHDFIRRSEATPESDRKTESEHLGRYLKWRVQERIKLEADFPLLSDDVFSHSFGLAMGPASAGQAQVYRERALSDYVRRTPTLAALKVENWQFRNAGFETLASIADRLQEPLPGGVPEIVYFLDPALARSATDEMSAAWKSRGGATPKFLDHADLNQLMSGLKGQTLVLVGHIEERAFVMYRGPGESPLVIDIPSAVNAAMANGVLFLPIGCGSARAGAFYGFQAPISTTEVAGFLGAIPKGALRIGDLLRGISDIGAVTVHVDALHSALAIAARTPNDRTEPPTFSAWIPFNNSTSTNFPGYAEQWLDANAPFYDKGRLSWIGAIFRGSDGLIPMALSVGLFLIAAALKVVQRLRAHLRAWALPIRVAKNTSLVLGTLLLLSCIFLVPFVLVFFAGALIVVAYDWLTRDRQSLSSNGATP